jgi:hypothetical protein
VPAAKYTKKQLRSLQLRYSGTVAVLNFKELATAKVIKGKC